MEGTIMLSLCIVVYGKENLSCFIAFLQNELKDFIKHHSASFYNLNSLWKAEANPELLKKNSRIVFPLTDTTCEFWGFFHVQNWNTLYSTLFSPIETNESIYYEHKYEHKYYTTAHLKSILRQIVHPFINIDHEKNPYDFSITYSSDSINDSKRVCIIGIDINSTDLKAFEFFRHFVCKLDTFFPDVFLSAYIDDSYHLNFDFKFDSEMLTRRIINTGKAFYVSDNLQMPIFSANETMFQQYMSSRMKNGTWFTQNDLCMQTNYDSTQLYDLLLPQYMVVDWTNLLCMKELRIIDFDTISVYYDRYSPDPILILSRGYSPIQLDYLSKERGDLVLQEQYPANFLLNDL